MKVFAGAVGKSLVPHLAENGHEVVALVRTPQKGKQVEAFGGKVAVADALDKDEPVKTEEDPLDPNPPASFLIGEGGVSMMTKIRGGSNAKAKRELEWQPIYPIWRRGFVEELS